MELYTSINQQLGNYVKLLIELGIQKFWLHMLFLTIVVSLVFSLLTFSKSFI